MPKMELSPTSYPKTMYFMTKYLYLGPSYKIVNYVDHMEKKRQPSLNLHIFDEHIGLTIQLELIKHNLKATPQYKFITAD